MKHPPRRRQRPVGTATPKRQSLLKTAFKIFRGTRALRRETRDTVAPDSNTFATARDDVADNQPTHKKIDMNKLKFFGYLRHFITLVGGIAVGVGYMDQGTATQLTGAVLAIAGFFASHKAPEKQD